MKPGKKFACVEMKAEIQERLLREVAEVGEEVAAQPLKRVDEPPAVVMMVGVNRAEAEGAACGSSAE